MPLLNPGDTFPDLTLKIPGGGKFEVPATRTRYTSSPRDSSSILRARSWSASTQVARSADSFPMT